MARRLEASDQKAKELAKKLEAHSFNGEEGGEYEASKFGGIGDYMRNKRIKLQNRDAHIRAEHASSYPPLFRGLAIWINGETYPTPYELGQLIVKHSGVRFQHLGGKTEVTHIVASNLTLKKRVEFSRYKVVRPEWITESIKAGVLLPWSEFRLIDETPAQRKLSFSSPAISRRSSASEDGSPGNAAGVFLGIKKVVDRPIATPGSSFMKRAVERQISEAGPSNRAANWPITTPENSRAKEATEIGQYVSQPITTPSSSIKKVVDQPRPGSSSLSRNIVIPPSDEPDLDEYDEFPSYQLPTNNTSFTHDPDDQPQRQSNKQDKIRPLFPQIDSHLYPLKEEKQGTSFEPGMEEEEDEDIDPVNLIFMPPSSPVIPKGAAQPHLVTPKLKIFPPTHSSPPPNTFLPHLAQKATETQKIHTPSVSEQPLTPKKSRTKPSPKLGPLVSALSSRPEAVTIIDGQEAYEVEAFIGENNYPKRKNRRAWTEYLVLWKGYPLEEASWEPERQLKQDLKDGEFDKLLKEWRGTQRRGSGNENEEENGRAKVFVEVPKKVLKSLDNKDGRDEDMVMEEPIVESSSPASVIVVRQPPENKKTEKLLMAKTNTEKTYDTAQVDPSQRFRETNLSVGTKVGLRSANDGREIRDSLSPEDMMDEDKDFGWGAEEERIMGSGSDKLFTQMVGESTAKSPVAPTANNSSQTKINQRNSSQIPNSSLESIYGTPVDFTGGFKEETLAEDLDIVQAPKSPTKDVVSPISFLDPMEEDKGEKAEKHNSPEALNMVDDNDPFKMEFLTPVELLEEREALPITEHLPKVAEPPERPSSPPEETLVPPLEATLHSQMTAEQKMTTYLSNPGIREQTCLNPGFLQKFHEESRLHQLSTWKAKLRAELQALAEAKSSTGQIKPKKSRPRRYILHVDFDCFFAAVSTRDRPDLAGKPVAITHGNAENSTSSDIASCNYAAREFGVKNGMWMEEARKLCPGIICLPYEFTKYEAASKAFYEEILSTGAERVQAVSVDEALVDISNLCCDMELGIEQEESMASVIATQIRNNCRERTGGLEVSVGIGGNVLLAKLAMKKAKPAGQYSIKSTAVLDFMDEVEVRELPGIGYNIAKKVEEKLGTNKVGDVRGISKERLKNLLGEKTGEKLWGYCRGLDDTVVGQMTVRKSVSVDVNWGVRFENQEQAEKFLIDIAEEIEKRMKQEGVKGKHLTLKVSKRAANAPFITPKHLGCGKCDTLNKSTTIGVATSNKDIIGKEAVTMLRTCRISPGELRGLGLTMARLEGVQHGKSDLGQKRLNYFTKEPVKESLKNINGEGSNGKKPEVAIIEENVPPERPLIKAYVKPKVTTLLDSFSKIAAARKEKAQLIQVQEEPEKLPDIPIGTQIDISMGVDPDVLPYLPTQHRNYIMQKMKEKEAEEQRMVEEESMQPQPSSQPPPGSQYDIEIWNQLGSELRAEIIAEHEAENRRIAREQGLASPHKGKPLPPSPRKNRPLPWAKNASVTPPQSPKIRPVPFGKSGADSPPKKKRGRPPGTKAGPSLINVNHERILDMKGNDVSGWLFDEGEVDREWFEAVDEESRQHQIAQAVKTRELRLEAVRKQELKEAAERERLASAVRLPTPSRQYTLGSGRAVGTIEQIRDTLSDWYEQCAEFGPHEDDTEEFAKFLKRLVLVEHNIPKADEVVRYFLAMVGHEEGEWRNVVEEFAKVVNGALLEMGLGPIDFEIGYDFYDFKKFANMNSRLTLVDEDDY